MKLKIKNILLILLSGFFIGCGETKPPKNTNILPRIEDNIRVMIESIPKNLSAKGPVAWLDAFDDTAGFFMVSDGALVFPDYDSARSFITNTLVKTFAAVHLHWSNVRIEPYSDSVAGIAANFREEIIMNANAGKDIAQAGYFTGIARLTSRGWKLHNAHWSLLPK
jgi:hypothetical protein